MAGKCLVINGKTEKALEVLLEGLSLLVSRSTFGLSNSSISFTYLAELITKIVISDVFAIEHASLLYIISWFSLESSTVKGIRYY